MNSEAALEAISEFILKAWIVQSCHMDLNHALDYKLSSLSSARSNSSRVIVRRSIGLE